MSQNFHNLIVLGLNHKTASIELRECFAFSRQEIESQLEIFRAQHEGAEVVVLSTCNRTEIYSVGISVTVLQQFFFKEVLLEHGYTFKGIEAVEHLMKVACGLDSLVLGEPEILGQVKSAFSMACLYKTVGPHLSRLFRKSFQVAKRVRTNTRIGACPISVASTAVKFAREWATEMSPRVLIIGSGQVGSVVAKHAQSLSSHPLMIVSRHLENAKALADEVMGAAGDLTQLPLCLAQADIVISSTSSKAPIITAEMLTNISHKILMMDLAVPRDIAPNVQQYSNVTLCQLDQLKNTIQQHVHMRAHAAMQAEHMIEEAAREFMLSLRALDSDEIIKRYRLTMEAHCEVELQKALRVNQVDDRTMESLLKEFSRNLLNKVLHLPCTQLRQASIEGRHDFMLSASELLGVHEDVK